jgi:hypothetical protein
MEITPNSIHIDLRSFFREHGLLFTTSLPRLSEEKFSPRWSDVSRWLTVATAQ